MKRLDIRPGVLDELARDTGARSDKDLAAFGPDPLAVDTLKPACRWGSEVPFRHATQDLHRAVQV